MKKKGSLTKNICIGCRSGVLELAGGPAGEAYAGDSILRALLHPGQPWQQGTRRPEQWTR